ncbi:cytochrome c [Lacibacter cauensis]|uniref:Cytochrome c n=1 Tax=Lacibacter cauensis TaxID=510947 RepID=A0A562SKF6_9BACT|nr:cytochrome c [Lacibacter cauensis]TWI81672.1 cytochrome c [Lacibacter cauensis]
MKFRFVVLLCIFSISCSTNRTAEWHTLDYGVFQLKAPSDWKKFKRQGIDSYVGGLTNEIDSLWFDYGWYSYDLGDEDPLKHKSGVDTVNGLPANIVVPITPGEGTIGMYIRVNRKDKFSIRGYDIKQTDTILNIFNSIVFKESDTSKKRILNTANLKEQPTGSGKTLYLTNCASCHAVIKTLTGPALIERVEIRDNEWIYRFLTNRKSIGIDTANIALRKKFGLACYEFPNLTKDQVSRIVDYIRN